MTTMIINKRERERNRKEKADDDIKRFFFVIFGFLILIKIQFIKSIIIALNK